MHEEDTIAQIATARGAGGIGIIRISGSDAMSIAAKIFRPANASLKLSELTPYRAIYGHIVTDAGESVDECLLLYMQAPHSYTAENVVELQCHGGAKLLASVLQLVVSAGARLAEAGEFTKRAFLNGRIDLTKAAAVMELINAKTDTALKLANERLAGKLSQNIAELREKLLAAIANIEATIDFPEDDIDDVVGEELAESIERIKDAIGILIQKSRTGRLIRDGVKTVIIGRPNAGKSSLMNAMLAHERAIVSSEAGTTRDTIEELLDIRGVPIRLIDTAGIRKTSDTIEQLGVERAKTYLEGAELILVVLDSAEKLLAEDEEIVDLVKDRDNIIVILNKADLRPVLSPAMIKKLIGDKTAIVTLSAKNSEGLAALEEAIIDKVYDGDEGLIEGGVPASERERELLTKADEHLTEAMESLRLALGLDFVSIDLRAAHQFLGEIIGEAVGEDIIDEIFSRFCIGK